MGRLLRRLETPSYHPITPIIQIIQIIPITQIIQIIQIIPITQIIPIIPITQIIQITPIIPISLKKKRLAPPRASRFFKKPI